MPPMFLYHLGLRVLRRAGLVEQDRLRDAWKRLWPLERVRSMGEFVRAVAKGHLPTLDAKDCAR